MPLNDYLVAMSEKQPWKFFAFQGLNFQFLGLNFQFLEGNFKISEPCDTRCSSATTLIMKRLEFGGQEFSKRPDMIGQSSGHSRCSVVPLGLDQSRGM
jgi:hypothetical protein